ncbi:hypothetical protein [Blastomonas fulva]|uniref:Uncharacterized protein n=1 Tax=Blastomonas fulva TaxID=1550728 RepID=A0ABM6M444_9SPHN|nr:hypothetical protein [Blastomonas fulva]ASR50667.1 hypothetical protein B5J99_03600 [Blastomonas fulva]
MNLPDDHGYGWWRQTFAVQGRSIDTYLTSGNGGQMLFVIPELEMTVMSQAGHYRDAQRVPRPDHGDLHPSGNSICKGEKTTGQPRPQAGF